MVTPPRSVDLAVKLIWACLTIGAINGAIAIWQLTQGRNDVIALVSTIAIVAVGLLWFFYWLSTKILKGRLWARAVYVILMVISMFTFVESVSTQFQVSLVSGLIFSTSSVLGYVAAILLFTKSAREWFRLDGHGPSRVA